MIKKVSLSLSDFFPKSTYKDWIRILIYKLYSVYQTNLPVFWRRFAVSLKSISSPVLGNILQQSKVKDGIRYIKILGVPCEAVYMFIRFLYSSWYI
uniref:Uncharacterized protein n=2 Tax=Salix viminalis TaxID=40686 RepID=A0A6N2K8E4_SALVM